MTMSGRCLVAAAGAHHCSYERRSPRARRVVGHSGASATTTPLFNLPRRTRARSSTGASVIYIPHGHADPLYNTGDLDCGADAGGGFGWGMTMTMRTGSGIMNRPERPRPI